MLELELAGDKLQHHGLRPSGGSYMDSGFWCFLRDQLDSQQRIIVGQTSLVCMRSLASTSSLAFGGRVSLHALLLGCSTSFTC
jgi:hypothetical protein